MTTTWNTTPEQFRFFSKAWDVAAAKAILSGKKRVKVNSLRTADWQHLLARSEPGRITMGISVDWGRAKTAEIDTSVPLILVDDPKIGPFIIDGWHRLAKAVLDGIAELPAIKLTRTESNKIKLAD